MVKFSTKTTKGITVISLEGTIMGGPDASLLNDHLLELLEKKRINVVIDLHQLTIINSTGLGILINCLKVLRNAGGDMKLANPSHKVLHLLEVTKLHKVFDIHKTVTSAVKAFNEM
ncbi:MAG: STAS domain-containing protein [Bacteroidetes bacterium]|nr:STAS domain-containing protein [Bacteroidota bacterium]